ncbi:MAG: hypothetical protein NZZ41_05340 [Candidatus Dojkabacteria bacterium]|nr:hypothetical protein [Candidatus Dojkabacteria bacterium]
MSVVKKFIVIKLGGSVVSTSEENIFEFEKALCFVNILRRYFNKYKFVVIIGGGFLARKYIRLIQENSYVHSYSDNRTEFLDLLKHEVGVAAVNLNAIVLKSLFFPHEVEDKILRYQDFDNLDSIKISKNVLISAAGHPGYSSDYNAYLIAKRVETNFVVSIKNIDGVYTSDPKKDKNAVFLSYLSWSKYLNIVGVKEHFNPGDNYPVDPLTAKLCMRDKIKFIIMGNDNGSFIEFSKLLECKDYKASIIE